MLIELTCLAALTTAYKSETMPRLSGANGGSNSSSAGSLEQGRTDGSVYVTGSGRTFRRLHPVKGEEVDVCI